MERAVVYPVLTNFYVLSDDKTFALGTLKSMIIEFNHKLLIATNVPFLEN